MKVPKSYKMYDLPDTGKVTREKKEKKVSGSKDVEKKNGAAGVSSNDTSCTDETTINESRNENVDKTHPSKRNGGQKGG